MGCERGPVGEGVVLQLQHLARRVRGRDDQGEHAAEAERHDGTVRRGERLQGTVRERGELVEVADDRETLRGRWEALRGRFYGSRYATH